MQQRQTANVSCAITKCQRNENEKLLNDSTLDGNKKDRQKRCLIKMLPHQICNASVDIG